MGKYNILAKSLRLKEIFLMTGFSFIGMLFTDIYTWNDWLKNSMVFLFVLFYVMSVYFLNSYADYESDAQSPRLQSVSKLAKSRFLLLLVIFTVLFCLLGLCINMRVFGFGISALFLWVLYYLPPLRLKATYLTGTFIHWIGGMLHFLTGYCSYGRLGMSAICIAAFFALLLCIGHFNHEIMDFEADKASGSRTTAVRIGTYKMQLMRTVLAIVTSLYWVAVYATGHTGLPEFILFLIPTVILAISSAIIRDSSVERFQKISRNLFLAAGLLMLIFKIGWAAKGYFWPMTIL